MWKERFTGVLPGYALAPGPKEKAKKSANLSRPLGHDIVYSDLNGLKWNMLDGIIP